MFLHRQAQPFIDRERYAGRQLHTANGLNCWEIRDPRESPCHEILQATSLSLPNCNSIPLSEIFGFGLFFRGRAKNKSLVYLMLSGATREAREAAVRYLKNDHSLQIYTGLKIDEWNSQPETPNIMMPGKGEASDKNVLYRGPNFDIRRLVSGATGGTKDILNGSLLSITAKNYGEDASRSGILSYIMMGGQDNFLLAPAHIFMPRPAEKPKELADKVYSTLLTRAAKGLEILSTTRDYALIPVPQGETFHQELQPISKEIVKQINAGEFDVSIITPSRGSMNGRLYGHPTYMKLPYAKEFTQLYPVKSLDSVSKGDYGSVVSEGDCGSVVIDQKTRQIYGFIVAASIQGGVAYITSADEILQDITKRLEGKYGPGQVLEKATITGRQPPLWSEYGELSEGSSGTRHLAVTRVYDPPPKINPYLPTRPSSLPAVPSPDAILKQPSPEDRKKELDVKIKDVPFSDIDPGVFNGELVKLGLYVNPDPFNLEKKAKSGGGNITTGTYSGTQAALTHAYSRIKRSYESYFDVLQIEPTLPRFTELAAKKVIFQYTPYPENPDGSIAQYPPHLASIPSDADINILKIFNALGLAETKLLLSQILPDKIIGKTAKWLGDGLFDITNGDISEAADQGFSIKAYEQYNKKHRKSGTDIEQGANIGLLPDWYTDRRFAEQSFTGTNPTTIEEVSQELLEEFIAAAIAGGYSEWAKSLPETDPASLFVQDYRYIRKAAGVGPDVELFHKEPTSENNWACAAVTLFQLHESGKLHPIAIVCDYKSTMANSVTIFNKRLLPTDPFDTEEKDWPWRYAKTCAQVSDWIRHEVGVHLTRAHMVEEALIVATHRMIHMDHIVFKLLEPHWYKTLSLNAATRSTLVPQVIKDLVGISPDQLYQSIRYEFENFDYVQHYVPNDLAHRGFPNSAKGLSEGKYKNYAYAKNMLSMWGAIREYVMSMLQTYFNEKNANGQTVDEMVRRDEDIKRWCAEVQINGWIKTFPTIQTLNELCDAVTVCIHIAAPYHTAVNHLQNFYQSFVLAKPPTLCKPIPKSLAELQKYTELNLIESLPIGRQRELLLAAQVPRLLSFKVASDRSLIMFAQSQWQTHVGGNKLDGQISQISEKFYFALKKLEVEFAITSNNMDKGSIPYMVMDPANTA